MSCSKAITAISFAGIAQGRESSVRTTYDGMIYAVDLTMVVTGLERDQAGLALRRVLKKNLVSIKMIERNTGGKGNYKTQLVSLKDALQLVMVLGGELAKETRADFAKILRDFFAGEESVVDQVRANAASDFPIAQLARACVETVAEPVAQDEPSLVRKRKLEELEIAKLEIDIEAQRTEVEARRLSNHSTALANRDSEREYFSKLTISLRELCQDTVMDERSRLILKDNFLNLAMLHAPSSTGNTGQALLTHGNLGQQNKPVSLSMIAVEMGMKVPSNELISIGAELKKRYVAKYGKEPSKHDQLCNGRMTKVNSYIEGDRPMIEDVLRWHASGRK